jgi:hypothetical protein
MRLFMCVWSCDYWFVLVFVGLNLFYFSVMLCLHSCKERHYHTNVRVCVLTWPPLDKFPFVLLEIEVSTHSSEDRLMIQNED